jgi:hypothetical protein
MIISLSIILGIRNVSHKICTENEKNTYFTFNNFFSENIVPFMRYVEKFCIAGQDTCDNVALVHCKPDT